MRTAENKRGQAAVRLIALLEAGKGSLVLLVGFGLLELIHRDLQQSAEAIIRHFHLNPASHYPKIFIDSLSQFDSTYLWLLSAAAFGYASLRLIEAWGLWRQRRWAEWLGALSGSIYLPIEIVELMHGVNWVKLVIFTINLLCVLLLANALRTTIKPDATLAAQQRE